MIMTDKNKLVSSGLVAFSIYIGLIFLILLYYNVHAIKAKNFVEKNADRVTVTLVNSDKTVFNKSAKESSPAKPKPLPTPIPTPIVKPEVVKEESKPAPVIPPKVVKPEVVKPVVQPPKVVREPVERATKKIPEPKTPVKKEPVKVEEPIKKTPPKEIKEPVKKAPSVNDLFSNVKTKTPVISQPKTPVKQPVVEKTPEDSGVKHNSSITDRIKATQLSGAVSNVNRERGVENAYIARVKQHMNNWDAGGNNGGQRVTIALTIYNSGKFQYRIMSGIASSGMEQSLREYLDTLNRMGLGQHDKSSPYSISVTFSTR